MANTCVRVDLRPNMVTLTAVVPILVLILVLVLVLILVLILALILVLIGCIHGYYMR